MKLIPIPDPTKGWPLADLAAQARGKRRGR